MACGFLNHALAPKLPDPGINKLTPEMDGEGCIADGEVVRIPATCTRMTGTLDFETDSFGVFALVCGV